MHKLNKIREIINLILQSKGINEIEVLKHEMNIRAIGFDSFDLAELTVRIEDEFAIDIFEDGIVETIGEILEKLNDK